MRGLAGKRALVTGATGLIGGAIARRLAQEGAHVIVASRARERALAWIQAQPPELRERCEAWALDLSDTEAIRRAWRERDEAGASPNVLIAAASLREGLATPASQLEHSHFERLFATDVAGHFLCARELVGRLRPGDSASLVWLSSVYAALGVDHGLYPEGMPPTPVQYAATKGAVHGLVAYAAAEWGKRGVRVNAVVSGGVAAPGRQPGDFSERYSKKTMLGRMATPDEIAAGAAFLASDDASYVTGSCLFVDGGFSHW